jgi:hypothetical protein
LGNCPLKVKKTNEDELPKGPWTAASPTPSQRNTAPWCCLVRVHESPVQLSHNETTLGSLVPSHDVKKKKKKTFPNKNGPVVLSSENDDKFIDTFLEECGITPITEVHQCQIPPHMCWLLHETPRVPGTVARSGRGHPPESFSNSVTTLPPSPDTV